MAISESVKKAARRIWRITITTVLVILGIILLILVLIQTGPVQHYGRVKIEAYLENKLHTRVRIGNLFIGFPSRIILKNIYLEDRRKDTLLYGGKIEVNISMLRIFHREIRINRLDMENITLKIKRKLPDSVFNYQFIVDAFSPGTAQATVTDTSGGFQYRVGAIHLHHVHAVYTDDASGNDMYADLGDFTTKLKTFDPAHQVYAIPDITLTDLSGKVRLYKPLLILQQAADTIRERNHHSEPVQLELGSIDFTRIRLNYRNEMQNTDAAIRITNFHTKVKSVNLASMHIKVDELRLHNTVAGLRIGKMTPVKKIKTTVANDTLTTAGNWSLDIARFTIDSSRFQYDDDNRQALKKGMDYNHLDVNHLNANLSDLRVGTDDYRAVIAGFSFDEHSGFILNHLSAQLLYSSTGAMLKNLVIQTPYSEIRNQTSLQYRSLDELKKHPGVMETNLVFDRARIAVKDILIFVPSLEEPLKDNLQAVLRLNGKLTGHLNDLHIHYLELEGAGTTSLAASGYIRGLPDANKAYYDVQISKLKTSGKDLYRLLPAKSIPADLRIPENISASGKFKGTIKSFFVQLHAITGNGSADLTGTLDLDRKSYDLSAGVQSLDLGYIFKQDSLLGTFTGHATAKGSGYDPKEMTGAFHVDLEKAGFKSYAYHGFQADARLQNGHGTLVSSMQDPNISYAFRAETQWVDKYPAIKMKLQLDTLNALALHLLKDSLQMHLMLDADFSSINPDSLQGRLDLSDIGWTLGSGHYHTDSAFLSAEHTDTAQQIRIRSEMADMDWTGQYRLTQVPESFRQFINHYYTLPVSGPDRTEPEHWQLHLLIRPSPLMFTLMPSLKGSDSLSGNIRFNSATKDFGLDLYSNKIQFNQQEIHAFHAVADTKGNGLDYKISVADAGHPGFILHQAALYGTLEDNHLGVTLQLKDKKGMERYLISGAFSKPDSGLRFVCNPEHLLLNYQTWQIPADNYIHYSSDGLIVRNLKLSYQAESISVNSAGETAEAPLEILFSNFKIKTITQFAEQDSLLLDGTIHGKAEIKSLFTQPRFTSDIKIDTLSFNKDTLGNLVLQVNNETLNEFNAHIALQGHDNDLQIDGKYFSGESKMDMNVKVNQLNLASFRGLVSSQVRGMTGYLKGTMHASGNLDQPVLKGDLYFNNATLTPLLTGEPLKLSNEKIHFDESGFNFDHFSAYDSAGNPATLDGNVFTKDYRHFGFDLTFSTQNFRIVNAPKSPDRLYYGKLNINADINLTGDFNLPKVNADLRVNKSTNFFVILPSEDPEVVDRKGVVVFVSQNKTPDSVRLETIFDSLAVNQQLKGMDVTVNIETDSNARFTLVIDERNGDALTMRGRARLSSGIDKSGRLSLTGNYELDDGSYNLTLSVLQRKFLLQRGSTITWTGDPEKALIDITASYTVNAPPIDLLQQQLAGRSTSDVYRYNQRLPFQVKLHMTGELLKPQIRFDITLPEGMLAQWPDVDTKLAQMRSDEAELNKQVFALLLLGRFVMENPFQSASAAVDAGTLARQSASRILGDQLNQLAGSLVKGVDINVDMNAYQDYTTGTALNQTELNVKVSKNLFNERVRVSVGSGFQLEQTNPGQNTTNIAGDISVDYRLSKDGRYMLRVFRKDQYETIVQGQVIETGLSFIITFDFNKFRELFENKKEEPVISKPRPREKPVNNPQAK